MIRSIPVLLLSLLALTTACEDDDGPLLLPSERCENGLRVGEELPLENSVDVEVIAVLDSRCPCDAVCLWPGQLDVVVEWGGVRDTLTEPRIELIVENGTSNTRTVYDTAYFDWDRIVVREVISPEDKCSAAELAGIEQSDYCVVLEAL